MAEFVRETERVTNQETSQAESTAGGHKEERSKAAQGRAERPVHTKEVRDVFPKGDI